MLKLVTERNMKIKCLVWFIGRKYCSLGRLSSETGWKYAGIIDSLEEKRKAKSALYYKAKKEALKLHAQAQKQVEA